MTFADHLILRQSLHNATSTKRQRRMDSEMGLRYLVKKYWAEVVEKEKLELKGIK